MNFRIKMGLILGALVLAPMMAVSANSAEFLRAAAVGGDDPVSFCCVQSSSSNGQGCYAVQNGAQGIGQCKSVYLDCGGDSFQCVPSQTAAPSGGVPFGTTLKDCSCFEFFIPAAAKQ